MQTFCTQIVQPPRDLSPHAGRLCCTSVEVNGSHPEIGRAFGSFVETNQHLGSLLLRHHDQGFLQPPENKPRNYWLGAEEVGLSATEVTAA